MQEEVFGPILPVLEVDSVEAVIHWVNSRPRPLGL
jgi:acyl-CoA reductase-like NAD-dependent aldehyde dehydrogenase